MRVIDQLTIEKIEELQREAQLKGMDIDWETASLKPYSNLPAPRHWENGDNAPQDPEQNWEKE